ncbi:MAG: 7-carboxy-7-deazaguanine synthase QueE [Sporomusaceae bacterium]|nr:7-carboxy-7-deazaguanine synthase QueE [Sporomusaceae bacterium]
MDEHIVEVFSSIQGEGPYVGYRQLFIRFAGCNLRCNYCDTAESFVTTEPAKLEQTPGTGDFLLLSNPISLDRLVSHSLRLMEKPHHSVSFTGGEPLCHVPALLALSEKLPVRKYLETNGTLYEELAEVLPAIDFISMDIKLPSSTGQDLFMVHQKFLQQAIHKEVFVKIVLTGQTTVKEFKEALAVIHSVSPTVPLVLQPVTAKQAGQELMQRELWTFFDLASEQLGNVRIIPQTHKQLDLL